MIIYENESLKSSSGYDHTYSFDPKRFKHDHTFAAIDHVLSKGLNATPVASCVDIGCGQGQVCDYVLRRAVKSKAQVKGEDFVGVDLSRVAIEQCEQRYPSCGWVFDTYQNFLVQPEITNRLSGRVDLVVNKGGLTFIENENELVQIMEGTRKLLRVGGIYLVVINRAFYRHWNLVRCRNWEMDIFEHAERILGSKCDISTEGNIIIYFEKKLDRDHTANVTRDLKFPEPVKRSETATGTEEKARYPRRLEITDKSNRVSKFPIANDRDTTIRLTCLEADRATNRVFIPTDQAKFGPILRLNFGRELAKLPKASFRVSDDAIRMPTTRNACKRLYQALAQDISACVLGLGFSDYLVDPQYGQPKVGLDEFQHRLDWIVRTSLQSQVRPMLAFAPPIEGRVSANAFFADSSTSMSFLRRLLTPVLGNTKLTSKEVVYCRRTAKLYLDAAEEIARRYGIPYLNLAEHLQTQCKSFSGHDVRRLTEVLAKTIKECLNSEVSAPPPLPLPEYQDSFPRSVRVTYSDGFSVELDEASRDSVFMNLPFSKEASNEEEGSKRTAKPFGRLGGRGEFEVTCQRALVSYVYRHQADGLPKTMVIGDSIRMRLANATGYVWNCYEALAGKVNLYHVPHNCGGTKGHLDGLQGWLAPQPEIVHINAGLHDLSFNLLSGTPPATWTSIDEYAGNVRWILETLRAHGVKHIFWGLNTPVHEEWHKWIPGKDKKRRMSRKNSDVRAYNEAASAVADELSVLVTDLYYPLWDAGIENVVLPDGVHLNHVGARIAGKLVSERILSCI